MNLLNVNDESTGHSIPHFHIHIISMKKDDGIDASLTFTGAKQGLRIVFKKVRKTNC